MIDTNRAERRMHERTPLEKQVTLAIAANGGTKYHDAITVDLSSQGARVRSKLGLAPGQAVEIVADSISRLPHVVHSQVVWTAKSETGLRFSEPVQMKTERPLQRGMSA